MKFNPNNKIREIFEDPAFKGYTHMLDFRRDNPDKSIYDMTLLEIQNTLIDWSSEKMAEGFSYLYDRAVENKAFYSYYSDEEKAANPDLDETGIAAFTLEKKSRFVLLCPGGGYGAVCACIEGYPLAKELNSLGYSVFVVSYRVGKKGNCPKPIDDLARALEFIISNSEKFNVSPEEYCILGFSAGAHLVSSWGVKEIGYAKYNLPKPVLVSICYPVITMGEYAHEGSRNNFLGSDADDEELIKKYSNELNVSRDYPATFMWQCDGDDVVPLENSLMMAMSLRKHGVPLFYEVYHYPTHGLKDYAQQYPKEWYKRMCEFWEEILKSKTSCE